MLDHPLQHRGGVGAAGSTSKPSNIYNKKKGAEAPETTPQPGPAVPPGSESGTGSTLVAGTVRVLGAGAGVAEGGAPVLAWKIQTF